MDVQVAIWQIADPDMLDPEGIDYDPGIVEHIVSTTLADGSGFVPELGELCAVVADPNTLDPAGTAQIIVVEMPLSTTATIESGAWASGAPADGYAGAGTEWIMYFEVDLSD